MNFIWHAFSSMKEIKDREYNLFNYLVLMGLKELKQDFISYHPKNFLEGYFKPHSLAIIQMQFILEC